MREEDINYFLMKHLVNDPNIAQFLRKILRCFIGDDQYTLGNRCEIIFRGNTVVGVIDPNTPIIDMSKKYSAKYDLSLHIGENYISHDNNLAFTWEDFRENAWQIFGNGIASRKRYITESEPIGCLVASYCDDLFHVY